MKESELLKLKQQIDNAKSQTAELKGHQSALLKQLKDDWKCNSVEEAERLVKKMDKEISDLNRKIEEGLLELEERYGN